MMQLRNGDDWAQGNMRDDDAKPVDWLPLTRVPATGARIGVLRNGEWVLETEAGLAHFRNGTVAFLPLMESARRGVEESFTAARQQAQIAGVETMPFPLDDVVLYGLHAGSYWADLSLNWIVLTISGETIKKRFEEALQGLAANKGVPQSTRHHAMRKLSMLRKSG